MKIGVARAYAADPVLTHQHGGVKVVYEIAPRVGEFPHNEIQDIRMTRRRHKYFNPGRQQHGFNELPGGFGIPGRSKHPRMRADSKKFIANVPGKKVRRRVIQALFDKGTARSMEFGLPVSSVQQDVGVENEQSGLFHRRVKLGTIRQVHECPTTAPGREHGAGLSPVVSVRSIDQNAP